MRIGFKSILTITMISLLLILTGCNEYSDLNTATTNASIDSKVDNLQNTENVSDDAKNLAENINESSLTNDDELKDDSAEDTNIVTEQKPYRIEFIGNDGSRDVYSILAEETRGYNINAYLSIPKQIGLNHMVAHAVKIGTEQSYEKTDAAVRDIALGKADYAHKSVTGQLNAVVLYIALPETNMIDGKRHLELDPSTLLSNDDYGHLDIQVCKVMDDAIAFLSEEKNITFPSKVDMVGYSGDGDFIVRFALLHPDRLWAVCAGGISWVVPLPVTKFKGEDLNYPLGINNINKYSSEFNLKEWKQIRFYCDMGLADDRGSYNEMWLSQLNWTSGLTYPDVWDQFCTEFVKYTQNAELVTYKNLGHTYDSRDYINFLKQNDAETFTVIEPVNSATVYTHDYKKDIVQNDNNLVESSQTGSDCKLTIFHDDHEMKNGYGFGTNHGYNYLKVLYDGEIINDYTFALTDENYGKVYIDSDGTLVLYTEEGNNEGSYITISYGDENITLHWYYPDMN